MKVKDFFCNYKKKFLVLFLLIIVLFVIIVGLLYFFNQSENKFYGTWTSVEFEKAGEKISIRGMRSLQSKYVLKKDGVAYYITSDGNSIPLTWVKTKNGIRIGFSDLSLDDGVLKTEEKDGIIIYFEKTSNIQEWK